MNKHANKILTFGLVLILMGSTQSKIRTKIRDASVNHLGDSSKIIVFGLNQAVAEGSKLLASSKIDGRAGISCNIEQLIKVAESQAKKAGGNIVKVTEIEKPDGFFEACHDIKVAIYFNEHINELAAAQILVQDSITESKFKESGMFAILNVYRPGNPFASAIGYDIYLNDSILWRAKNNSKSEVKLYKEGKMILRTKAKAKSVVTVEIKPGEEYFFKCEVIPNPKGGFAIPQIYLIDKSRGRSEYEAVKKRD